MTKLKNTILGLYVTVRSFFPERMAQSLEAADAQITRFLSYAGFDPTNLEHRNALFAYCVGLPGSQDYFYPRKARQWIRRQWAQLHLYTASLAPNSGPDGIQVKQGPLPIPKGAAQGTSENAPPIRAKLTAGPKPQAQEDSNPAAAPAKE